MSSIPSPIEVYGLDKPHTSFAMTGHQGFKLKDIKEMNGVTLKAFEDPVYVYVKAKVRGDGPKYGKYLMSIEPDQADFLRMVEDMIITKFDMLALRAEPVLEVDKLAISSLTYENLLKVKLSRTVGQDVDGKMVKYNEHEKTLSKGVNLAATVEISGVYHSGTHKGVVAKLHSYRVV